MSKDLQKTESVIAKPLPVDFKDTNLLAEFLEQPTQKIAEGITGALDVGLQGLTVAGARIAQGALKGQFYKQVAREIRFLVEKGKIPEDYAEKKYGFQSLTELLRFIDEEEVDEDRLYAIRAMFYALNKSGNKPGEELLSYQLFKLSKELTAPQLLLLRASSRINLTDVITSGGSTSQARIREWLRLICEEMGHGIETLILQDEKVLIEKGLLEMRLNSVGQREANGSYFSLNGGRLTDLGSAFSERVTEFEELRDDLS